MPSRLVGDVVAAGALVPDPEPIRSNMSAIPETERVSVPLAIGAIRSAPYFNGAAAAWPSDFTKVSDAFIVSSRRTAASSRMRVLSCASPYTR